MVVFFFLNFRSSQETVFILQTLGVFVRITDATEYECHVQAIPLWFSYLWKAI
jgi:hypothetical protein